MNYHEIMLEWESFRRQSYGLGLTPQFCAWHASNPADWRSPISLSGVITQIYLLPEKGSYDYNIWSVEELREHLSSRHAALPDLLKNHEWFPHVMAVQYCII